MNDTSPYSAGDHSNAGASKGGKRAKAKTAIELGRTKVNDSVSALRVKADEAVDAGAHVVEANPFSAIAGAVALGATLGALLPATRREQDMIGPLGQQVRGALDASFAAAKSAGIEQFSTRGLTSTALTTGLSGIVVSVIQSSLTATRKQPGAQGAIGTTEVSPATANDDEPKVEGATTSGAV